MRKSPVGLFLFALLAPFQLIALAGEWPQEPSSFLGVAFDKPLRESVKKPCPLDSSTFVDKERAGKLGETCFTWPDRKLGFYTICCFEELFPGGDRIQVRTVDERLDQPVGEVRVYLKRYEFDRVAQLLTEKYGPPHKTEQISPLKRQLVWEGRNVVIVTPSSLYADTYAFLRVFSMRFWQASEAKRRERDKKATGKM